MFDLNSGVTKKKLAIAESKIRDLEEFAEKRFSEFKIILTDLEVLRPRLDSCEAENKILVSKLESLAKVYFFILFFFL